MSPATRWALALAFIWALTGLNVTGVRVTGWTAVALGVGSLAPAAIFTVVAGAGAEHVPWIPFARGEGNLVAGLGLGLAVMMWNYSGWDNPSTVLGETRAPASAYRRALFVALPLIVLAYLLPVAAGLAGSEDWGGGETGHLPT